MSNIRKAFTDQEYTVALLEIELLGLIEWSGDSFRLTDKGVDKAIDLLDKHTLKDKILIALLCGVSWERTRNTE